MDPDYGRVIGVDVGETRIRVEMFDMTMEMRASADYALDAQQQGIDVVVDRVNAGLASVLADGGGDPSAVLGAGIGVPGVVEHEGEESLVYAQTYGWDAAPLGRLLRPAGDFPLYIENGAKTMGQAELWFGGGGGARQVVVCRWAPASAQHRHRRPRPGRHGRRGRVGHTTVEVGGRPCRCGSRGCLEAYVGAGAILDRYGLLAAGRGRGGGAGRPGRGGRRAVGRDPRRDRAVPRRRHRRPGEPVRSRADHPRGWAGLLLGQRRPPAIREAAKEHSLTHQFAQTSIELEAWARTRWRWAPPRSRWSASSTARCPPARETCRTLRKNSESKT